jgi:glycosyltransferase involved in cell wall biosynthesis
MINEPFVSIVTPVYNGDKYLEECIISVLEQTYSNWEYIIVDNQSKDNTFKIASKYAELDSRIKVITNDLFLPVMKNFNNAINKISKKSVYCKVICADDWIYPEYLSQTIDLAEHNPTVGIVSSYKLMGNKIVPTQTMPYRQTVFSGREASRMNLLNGPYPFGTPTALLFRSEIVLGTKKFFNEDRTCGDIEACYDVLKNWNFGFVPQILSFNRTHADNISFKVNRIGENFLDHIYMHRKYGNFFLEKDEFILKEKELWKQYYRFLGSNLKQFINKDFREFQKKSLQKYDIQLEWKKVLWGGLNELARNIIDVKGNIKKFIK